MHCENALSVKTCIRAALSRQARVARVRGAGVRLCAFLQSPKKALTPPPPDRAHGRGRNNPPFPCKHCKQRQANPRSLPPPPARHEVERGGKCKVADEAEAVNRARRRDGHLGARARGGGFSRGGQQGAHAAAHSVERRHLGQVAQGGVCVCTTAGRFSRDEQTTISATHCATSFASQRDLMKVHGAATNTHTAGRAAPPRPPARIDWWSPDAQ